MDPFLGPINDPPAQSYSVFQTQALVGPGNDPYSVCTTPSGWKPFRKEPRKVIATNHATSLAAAQRR